MSDTYEIYQGRLPEFRERLKYIEGATGMSVAVGKIAPVPLRLDVRDVPDRQTGRSNQRSPTPISLAGFRASLRFNLETGAPKIRGRVTNEKRANVAVQIKMLIPA